MCRSWIPCAPSQGASLVIRTVGAHPGALVQSARTMSCAITRACQAAARSDVRSLALYAAASGPLSLTSWAAFILPMTHRCSQTGRTSFGKTTWTSCACYRRVCTHRLPDVMRSLPFNPARARSLAPARDGMVCDASRVVGTLVAFRHCRSTPTTFAVRALADGRSSSQSGTLAQHARSATASKASHVGVQVDGRKSSSYKGNDAR